MLIDSWPVLNHKSLLAITPGQYTLRNILRLTLVDEIEIIVTLLVSELYNKTAFTLVLKILILVVVRRSLPLPTRLSIPKTCSAFFLLCCNKYNIIYWAVFVFCLHFSTISSITNSSMVSSLCSSRHRPRQGMFSTQRQQLHSMSIIHNRLLGKLAAGMCRPYVGCMPTFVGLLAGHLLWQIDWWLWQKEVRERKKEKGVGDLLWLES